VKHRGTPVASAV